MSSGVVLVSDCSWSFQLYSSEHLQQQIFLLNQQLILLKETNGRLTEVVESGHTHHYKVHTLL